MAEYAKDAYEKRAVELCESAVGGSIPGHVDKDGAVIRCDRKKNDFAKGHPDEGVYTMFKPEKGMDHYTEMRKVDPERGGKA